MGTRVSMATPVTIDETSGTKEIKRYLKTLIDLTFQGEVDGSSDSQDAADLGKVMKKLHLLTEEGKTFDNNDETKELIDKIASLRSDEGTYREKLIQDYKKFLGYRQDVTMTKVDSVSTLKDDDFWGTRQQLLSGKVVGDMLGGVDPVFGSLLNPTGGRIGAGNAEPFHNMLYKKDEPIAYHAAVHDAFGYLFKYHGKGPGYNYLNTRATCFKTASPLACQVACLKFWKKTLERKPVRCFCL